MGRPKRVVARRALGRVRRALRHPVRTLTSRAHAHPPSPRKPHDLLRRTALFDLAWYQLQTGFSGDRAAAIQDYLSRPVESRPSPNPLFDRQYYLEKLPADVRAKVGKQDPFIFFLDQRKFSRLTHPHFDTRGYLTRNPEAGKHPEGPLRHYLEVGGPEGLQPNNWLAADEHGKHPNLHTWMFEAYRTWARERPAVRRQWRARYSGMPLETYLEPWPEGTERSKRPLVSVILDAGLNEDGLRRAAAGLAAQTYRRWELLVVDRGRLPGLDDLLGEALPNAAPRIIRCDDDGLAIAHNEAITAARGDYVAFLEAGDTWRPHRLALLVKAVDETAAVVVLDDLARTLTGGKVGYAASPPPPGGYRSREIADLGRLLLSREALRDLAGFDPSIRGAWKSDLVLRASRACFVEHVPVIGTDRDAELARASHHLPPSRRRFADPYEIASWVDVALNKRLIDWSALAHRRQDAGTISVIIPTFNDWQMTVAAVASVMDAGAPEGMTVECIVWDNGSDWAVAQHLATIRETHPEVRLLHSPVNHGFALGNNLALAEATGATVMFLNNDTVVPPNWLDPVVGSLQDPDVLGVQSLLIYPSGSIQSAGVAFPSTGGLPHAFLAGFPVEDARGIEALDFSALTGAALAVRFSDAVALEGFDPIFTNGMEDVDICLRLGRRRPGRFTVVSGAPVVHHESRSPGRYLKSMENRRVYQDRWRGVLEPRDDVRLWAAQGYTVIDHELVGSTDQPRELLQPAPVLVRTARLQVTEIPRPLRWAIKNPAPPGPGGEVWGDTHFSRAVADALRALGQEVVEDRRPEMERATGRHDDVALVLRGLAGYRPSPENISFGWVISHPDKLARWEAESYDLLLAASRLWSEDTAKRWNIRVEPLLQATDPARFHPDAATPDTGHPVLFVGASRNVYRDIIQAAVSVGLPLSLYGHGWEQFVHKRYIKGQYLPNSQLGAAYRSAGVVLNDHWDDMREKGFLSNRLFDAVASGARVVTDDVAGLRDVFGDSVQVFRDAEDLTRLTSLADPDPVFGDDDARRAAADYIHREHSFRARAERLIELAHIERKRRGFDT